MEESKYNCASIPTVRRLPIYLHLLKQMQNSGREFVSSTHIAEKLKLESIQVRKDLANTGIVGKPRVGYYVPSLIDAIEKFLGWDNNSEAFLVGVGSLGSALLGYDGFARRGLDIVAAFENDNTKIGSQIRGKEVLGLDKLPGLAARMGIRIGIITVPADEAQVVCDIMVSAGILAIWNFTPANLETPEEVVVQNEDLSCGLAVLSVKLSKLLQTHKD
jgi:redox-sensing transcriptional repressor